MQGFEDLSWVGPCPLVNPRFGGEPGWASSRNRGFWPSMVPPGHTSRCHCMHSMPAPPLVLKGYLQAAHPAEIWHPELPLLTPEFRS